MVGPKIVKILILIQTTVVPIATMIGQKVAYRVAFIIFQLFCLCGLEILYEDQENKGCKRTRRAPEAYILGNGDRGYGNSVCVGRGTHLMHGRSPLGPLIL